MENRDFVKDEKINEIKKIMLKCGEVPEIIDGWLEGDIISLILDIIELDLEEEFNKIVSEIKKSTAESYRNIIGYMIENKNSYKNNIKKENYNKYFNKLNE